MQLFPLTYAQLLVVEHLMLIYKIYMWFTSHHMATHPNSSSISLLGVKQMVKYSCAIGCSEKAFKAFKVNHEHQIKPFPHLLPSAGILTYGPYRQEEEADPLTILWAG